MPGLSKLIREELDGTNNNPHAAMSPENNDHTQVSFSAITKIQGAPGKKAPRLAVLEDIQPCALDSTQKDQIQFSLNLPQ